jgi:Xaa-Pro aminopeptidase
MRSILEVPKLSLRERDRRWAAVRQAMSDAGLDCLILFGWPLMWDFHIANARYLCPIGGNSAQNILVFPLDRDPTCFVFSAVGLDYWRTVQDWVSDIRPRNGSWGDSIATRIKELGLGAGAIGMDGLANPLDPDGWVPQGTYARLQEALPQAKLVNIGGLIDELRTIKSGEEIDILNKAAVLGDLMLQVCRDTARPGVRESEVYGRMREVMVANGGEEPTLLLWASDRHPLAHPFHLPSIRQLEAGDLILCEMHPKYGGYCTHVERTFCLGEPDPKYRKIYEGCLATYQTGMELFGPGRSISAAMEAVKDTMMSRGLGFCELGIHGHGLGSLEYPRYRHHAITADQQAIKAMNDEFRPGMVFAFNIDLFDPQWHDGNTGCVFAETVEITESGARRMHTYSTEFQAIVT